jgi:hypothetical protein
MEKHFLFEILSFLSDLHYTLQFALLKKVCMAEEDRTSDLFFISEGMLYIIRVKKIG